MAQRGKPNLNDRETSRAFYEERYAHDYMASWPAEKKRRVFDLVRGLELPPAGEALDFGCGNGILTDVVRQALPSGWRMYGTDISATAIENAGKRYPACGFFAMGDGRGPGKRFDFVFTHHVLEHVHDAALVLGEIDGCMKDVSTMLHILPCGNEGSFERGVCLLRKDGIDPGSGNRYFFEDEGHLRRLTTEQCAALCAKHGFALTREYYANQYDGAINYFTQMSPDFIRMFTESSKALDEKARSRLKKLRHKLLGLRALRYPVVVVESRLKKGSRTFRDYLLIIAGAPFCVIAKPVDVHIKRRALREWELRKTERNGSEMYLVFKRG
jgi:SAM-dependent methyltransferase